MYALQAALLVFLCLQFLLFTLQAALLVSIYLKLQLANCCFSLFARSTVCYENCPACVPWPAATAACAASLYLPAALSIYYTSYSACLPLLLSSLLVCKSVFLLIKLLCLSAIVCRCCCLPCLSVGSSFCSSSCSACLPLFAAAALFYACLQILLSAFQVALLVCL
jgi:hypothetical protein